MQLTPDQARAVRSWQRGDVCVVAGPGSGKTRVLVERVRWLILDRGVPPERVLAITFTEKAAHEMRVRLLADGAASDEDRSKFQAAQISTIDAFCNRLLKENALQAGVDPAFEILDEVVARELLHGAIDQVLETEFARREGSLLAFLDAFEPGASRQTHGHAFGLRDDIAALVYRVRSYGCEPFLSDAAGPWAALADALRELAAAKELAALAALADRLRGVADSEPSGLAALIEEIEGHTASVRKVGRIKSLVVEIKDVLLPECRAAVVSTANQVPRRWLLATVRKVLTAFSAAKRASGRMDFDDVLEKAAGLLGADSGPRLLFEHVLIDEFQDTNPLQVRLVQRLLDAHGARRPVRFVVGDINQSIYGFRHADQNVFRAYRESVRQQGGDVIRLSENFRSRPEVLAAVHRLLPGAEGGGIEEHRLQSTFRFPAKSGSSCEVRIATAGGERAVEREASMLAERLLALHCDLRVADRQALAGVTRPLRWNDIALLARTHDRAARLAAELRRLGVPCRSEGGRGLFQSPETAELAAFLRLLRNPRDEVSMAAILKSAFCGIGDALLLCLKQGRGNLADLLAGPLPTGDGVDADSRERLRRFREFFLLCRADRATVPVRFLLASAVAETGYRAFLDAREDSPRGSANVDRLLEWIGRRETQGATGVDAVSDALDRALENPPAEQGAPDRTGSADAIEILTMHAAKGLEFPVVVLVGLQSDPRGMPPGLLFSDTHGIGARWRGPFGDEAAADSAYRATRAEIERREAEEADRLLYVAMTRAEEHLVLSASFPGAPQKRHWCKLLFDRFGIDPKSEPSGAPEERSAGECRFAYRCIAEDPPEGVGTDTRPANPVALRPLPLSAQADYSAAVTSVSEFARCPHRYFLSRYLGLERSAPPTRRTDRPSSHGRHRRARTSATDLGEQVHRHLAGQLDDAKPVVRRLAKRFRDHELGHRVERAERVDREMGFVFTVGEFLLNGTIDLLFEEGGERILLDYKTDQVRDGQLARSAQRYANQIQLYAAGLAKSGHPADRAILFYLRPGAPVDVDISRSALQSSSDLVAEFFAAQRSQEYPMHTGQHCYVCPHFRGDCPARLP